MRGGDRETATTQVKEVETATGQQGGVQLGGQLWPSGQWQMRPVVVVMQHQRKLPASSGLPHTPSEAVRHCAIRQWRYCTVTTNNFTQLYISCQGQVRPYRQHCNILEFLYSYKGSISISAVTRYKVLHLAMLSHVQHEGGVASPLTCQAL